MNTFRMLLTMAGAGLATFLLGTVVIRVQPHACLECGPGDHVVGYHLSEIPDPRFDGDPDQPTYRLSHNGHGLAGFEVSKGSPHYKCWCCRKLWRVRDRSPGAIVRTFWRRVTH